MTAAADKMLEEVLVLPADRWHMLGAAPGFGPAPPEMLAHLLDPRYFEFRTRREVETDPAWLQLIPYQVLACDGEIWHYVRGHTGTETRLQSRGSIGIGGHISRGDGDDPATVYDRGRLRELREEVDVSDAISEAIVGIIFDPSTPVGRVHLGIVHRLELPEASAIAREEGIVGRGFETIDRLLGAAEGLESWSVLTLQFLRGAERAK